MAAPDFSDTYQAILNHIKDCGIRVFHRDIKGGAGGYYDAEKCIITIDKSAHNKIEGCYYLCHEKIHYDQARINRFPGFFEMDNIFSEEKLALIIAAEMDAVIGGHKMLKKWGINYEPKEMTKAGLEQSTQFWKEYYFKDISIKSKKNGVKP